MGWGGDADEGKALARRWCGAMGVACAVPAAEGQLFARAG